MLAQLLQSCPTLCDSMDCNPPGSSVCGILQARTLEWVAALLQGIEPTSSALQVDSLPLSLWVSPIVLLLLLLLSRFSRVWLCAIPWTAAHRAPLSWGFSRQEHWSGLPFPSPTDACMLSRFSRVRLCVTPWTAAHQAPLSMAFSRQEHWSGLPFPYSNTYIKIKQKNVSLFLDRATRFTH